MEKRRINEKSMKKSIKARLVKSYMIIIIITVLILEIVILTGIRTYYYKNLEDILENEIKLSLEYYSRYYSSKSLKDIILDDSDVFWQHTKAQVQIFTNEGELLMDSLGSYTNNYKIHPDIENAIKGGSGRWVGKVEYSEKPVMAFSAPIENRENIIGIIRFVTSLEETNALITKVSLIIIAMGITVIFIAGLVSIVIANSIVRPLKQVTDVAEKMANGELQVRSSIDLEDEIGKLSDTLNYMAEELIKKEELKNEFISSVSHELRTPLTSIKGWAITLKSEELGENDIIKDGLDIIEKESDRLSLMVEELLDFSKFVSGRITLEKKIFNIKDTLSLMGKQLKPRANLNKIKFDIDLGEDLGYIKGDENRLKQVVINLLDNAFKFTSEDGWVNLKAYRKDEDIIIEVSDNGAGISSEDLPKIKERFYKGKNSKSHSGLGLSISDEIVKMHGGSMEIFSEIDRGTRAIVILPLGEVEI